MSTADPGFNQGAHRVKAIFGYSKDYAHTLTEVARENVPEVAADAWDAALEEAHGLGWLHDWALSDAIARNPYRAKETPA